MNTKLSRFKFAIEDGIYSNRQTRLYTNLDDALLALNWLTSIELVPSGHSPWQSKLPELDGMTSPLKHLGCWPWLVLCESHFDRPGEEPFRRYLGEFGDPRDAFQFAELKTKEAKRNGESKYTRFFVCLWAYAENGCRPEIARLPADHLARLFRERDRRRRLQETRRAAWFRAESASAGRPLQRLD